MESSPAIYTSFLQLILATLLVAGRISSFSSAAVAEFGGCYALLRPPEDSQHSRTLVTTASHAPTAIMPHTATTTMRKISTATGTALPPSNDPNAPQRRTTSGRAVRANTTRPSNYYIKPYASFNAAAAAAANNAEAEMQDVPPPGFFPAITYFTDAIAALPKEVMRQFTLMKEVEAKIHGPNEKLGEAVDAVMEYPVPRRKERQSEGPGGAQGLLSFTANNSVTGSTSASLVNGVAPNAHLASAQNSVSDSVNGEEAVTGDEELAKRQHCHELRLLASKLLINLDEKNVVLAEANRILAQQHMRIDSVMPHIDSEISEEARLGSMTHWAYGDNRQKRQPLGAAPNRRDVAGTNSLAAAASAIHESDIAQARRDAGRETAREKHKGRSKDQVDSDFDDKPKKTHAKTAKSKTVGPAGAAGLGISANGEPVKKRKVDKGLAAPAMDRSMSSKGPKAVKETPRSTPNAEVGKKLKAKPAPLQAKRKGVTSASPAMASSPLHSSFNANNEPARPQSARLRQNSTATNLRHERVANEDRPTSAHVKANGEKTASKRKATDDGDANEETTRTIERPDKLNREDADLADTERPYKSRSGTNSGKAGRGSASGTPQQESFGENVPAMLRTRSTRSLRREDSSSEPQVQGPGKHKRQISNSHLVRQLAPFNRSPDLDRVHLDDMDEDLDSTDGHRERPERESAQSSPPKRRPVSRRNTLAVQAAAASSPPISEPADEDDPMPDAAQASEAEEEPEAPQDHEPEAAVDADIEDEDRAEPSIEGDADDADALSRIDDQDEDLEDYDSEPGDPDDPNEPKYCYCDRGSYGEMIACDNEQCPREWFHLGCTGLKEPPEEEEKWFCRDCAPLFSHQRERAKNGRGRGRGRRG